MLTARNSLQYWPSLNHLAKCLRSPAVCSQISQFKYEILPAADNSCTTNKPSSGNSFPLPGDTGFMLPSNKKSSQTAFDNWQQGDPLEQFAENKSGDLLKQLENAKPSTEVDVCVNECPKQAKDEVQSLFANKNLPWPMTAVTISLHTKNDMVAWSQAVADERDLLTAQFIASAIELCSALHTEGYFADFIDPSSGRPFLSKEYTSSTLFETNPIQRHFGVKIKDLGCCKVVEHAVWGTKVFVGTLFTNAPKDSSIVKQMMSPNA